MSKNVSFKQKLNAVFVVVMLAVSLVEFVLFRATMLANLATNEPSLFTIVRELGWSGGAAVLVGLAGVYFADSAIADFARANETKPN